MNNIEKLEQIFSKFPGIGPRQAKRFVHHLVDKPANYIREFTDLIKDVCKSTNECSLCHRIFLNDDRIDNQNTDKCSICLDKSRDYSKLMIVARDSDFEAIDKSGAYNGLYFILGGTVAILDNEPNKNIRLNYLLKRITDEADSLSEIILSMNTTPEGDNTALIISTELKKIIKENKPIISILGRGLSTGAELEYADPETIKNALQSRHLTS